MDGEKTGRAITGNLKHAQSQQDDLTFALLKVNTHNEYFQFISEKEEQLP